MSEQSASEEEVRRQESREAQRILMDAMDSSESRARARAFHERLLQREARVAAAVSKCIQALNDLGTDSMPEDMVDIDELRDRTLRALRAIYFPKPESPLNVVLDQVLPQLQPLLEQYIKAVSQPGRSIVETPVPGVGYRNPATFAREYQEALERMRHQAPWKPPVYASPSTFTAAPDGTVTPPEAPEEPESRVKQYWESLARGLSVDELFEVHRLAQEELEARDALDDDADDEAVDSIMEQFDEEDEAPPSRRSSKRKA